jgi:hypothetical protein
VLATAQAEQKAGDESLVALAAKRQVAVNRRPHNESKEGGNLTEADKQLR